MQRRIQEDKRVQRISDGHRNGCTSMQQFTQRNNTQEIENARKWSNTHHAREWATDDLSVIYFFYLSDIGWKSQFRATILQQDNRRDVGSKVDIRWKVLWQRNQEVFADSRQKFVCA